MTDAASVPPWFTGIVSGNHGGRYLLDQVEDSSAPHGQRIRVRFTGHNVNYALPLDLCNIPAGETVWIDLTAQHAWELSNLDQHATLVLNRFDEGHVRELTIKDTVRGTVVLRRPDGLAPTPFQTPDENCTTRVVIESGEHYCVVPGKHVVTQLKGGCLTAGVYERVHLDGDVRFGSNHQTSGTFAIRNLFVTDTHTIRIWVAGPPATIDTVMGSSPEESTLKIQRDEGSNTNQQPALHIKRAHDITLEPTANIQLGSAEAIGNVTIGTHCTIQVSPGGQASNLHLKPTTPAINLLADQGAVLTGITGTVALGKVAGAHLEGTANQPFNIADIHATVGDGTLDGVFLRAFKVPNGLTGRRLLGHLDNAHVIEPATKGLPGTQYRLWGPNWRHLGNPRPSLRTDDNTLQDAELLRQLHQLAKTKGANGETRTTLGWLAQRLRHITTQGKLETLCLNVYRTLGYGERPLPALVTWAAVSLLCGLIQFAFHHNHWWNTVTYPLEQAIGPISAILHTGGPNSGSGPGAAVAHALVAIPLITGLLSLRQYVLSCPPFFGPSRVWLLETLRVHMEVCDGGC